MTTEQELIAEGEAVYYGTDNTHTLEWEDKYFGVSTLVKNPAMYYAKRYHEQIDDERPRKDRLWSFIGNKHADAALAPVTKNVEIQGRVDIGEDHDLVGHADGYTLKDGGRTIISEEHKDYATVENNDAVQLAWRQAVLNLGIVREAHRLGQRVFPVADFCDRPDAEPLTLPDEWPENMFIRVWVCPRFGPSSITHDDDPTQYDLSELAEQLRPIKVWRVTHEDLDSIVDFYSRKVAAVYAGPEEALAWDTSMEGLLEFYRDIRELKEVVDEDFTEAARKYAEAKAAKKKAEAVVKGEEEAELKAMLAIHGEVTPNGKNIEALIPGVGIVNARYPKITHLQIKEES